MSRRVDTIIIRRRRVVPAVPYVPTLGGVGRRQLLVILRRNAIPEPIVPLPTWLSAFNTITFGGLLLPPPTVPVTDGATLFDATRNYLKSLDSMSELTEVYKNRPKRGWSYPYMVITPINADSELTNKPAYFDSGEFQFSTVSDDDIQAETIGEAAYNALLPTVNPRLTFDDGFEKVRTPLYHGRMQESVNRGPSNQNIWTHSFGYKILTGRVTTLAQ